MIFKCPKGTKKQFRFRTIKKGRQRLGGCAIKGRFVKVKEVKTFKNKKVTRRIKSKNPEWHIFKLT